MRADNAPEAGRVIGFEEVGEFVDHHVIDYEHRGLDEPPIETNIVVDGAGAPAVAAINDFGRPEPHAKSTGVLLDPAEYLFPGPRNVPIPQNFTALGLMPGGHQEEMGKFDVAAGSVGNFDPVVSPEVGRGLPVHYFLAGRVQAVLIFLRMPEFRQYPLAL